MKIEISQSVEIDCSCGNSLEAYQGKLGNIIVEPCKECLRKEYEEGYEKGETDGTENG